MSTFSEAEEALIKALMRAIIRELGEFEIKKREPLKDVDWAMEFLEKRLRDRGLAAPNTDTWKACEILGQIARKPKKKGRGN